MSPASPRRDDLAAPAWVGELADVRERLARLETRAEAQEAAAAERHRQLLDGVKGHEERLEQVEGRAWKVALGLAALGLGGGAGAVELVRGMLGG